MTTEDKLRRVAAEQRATYLERVHADTIRVLESALTSLRAVQPAASRLVSRADATEEGRAT